MLRAVVIFIMFALVLFDDGYYYVCKHSEVIKKNKELIVRYKGARYSVQVVAFNADKHELNALKQRLEREECEEECNLQSGGDESDCSVTHVSPHKKKYSDPSTEKIKENFIPGEEDRKIRDSLDSEQHGVSGEARENSQSVLSVTHCPIEGSRNSDQNTEKIKENFIPGEEDRTIRDSLDSEQNGVSREARENSQSVLSVAHCAIEGSRNSDQNTEKIKENFIPGEEDRTIRDSLDSEQNGVSREARENSQSVLSVAHCAIEGSRNSDQNTEKIKENVILGEEDRDIRDSLDSEQNGVSREARENSQFILPVTHCPTEVSMPAPTVILQITDINNRAIGQGNNPRLLTNLPIYEQDIVTACSTNANIIWQGFVPNVPECDPPLHDQAHSACDTAPVSAGSLFETNIVQSTMANSSLDDILPFPAFSYTNIREDEEYLSHDARFESTILDESGDENDHNCSGGSTYVPTKGNSDSGDADWEDSIEGTIVEETPTHSRRSENISTDLDASLAINKVGHSAPDDTKMFVKTVESGIKKDFCIYCKTDQGKLSRHVARKHKKEEDVAQYLSFQKGSDERKKMMAAIRKKGQFYFNTSRDVNTGERKVTRRPNVRFNKTATDFATCPNCLADYSKKSLRHHSRRCDKKARRGQRSILLRSKRTVGRVHALACDVLRNNIVSNMRDDDVLHIFRYDELAIIFGNKLCQKYTDRHYYDYIRQKLRHIGRFLIEIQKHNNDINDLFSVFFPKNYDCTIAAIQSLAGMNKSQTGFKVPSLATTLGTILKKVAKLCISEWIKRQNKENQTYAEDFLKLLTEDYTTSIARAAYDTQARMKRKKTTILPSQEDIDKLNTHLRNEIRKNYRALKKEFSMQSFIDLGAAVLLSIELFNRRRPGEMERTYIEDFRNYKKIDQQSVGDAYNKFSVEEKQAAEKYVRFEIRGKLRRDVGVLLDKELLTCVELLLSQRSTAKVHKGNPYVFGIPGKLKGDYRYHRACALMRKYANDCGAEKPTTLRWTTLRKHVATMCVNYNLTDGEVSDLADFMGHHERIHKTYYRQPIITRQIIQVSKLLEAVQGKEGNGDSEDESDISDQGAYEQNLSAEATLNELPSTSTFLCEDFDADTSVNKRSARFSDDDEPPAKIQKKKRSTSPYGKCSRRTWTFEEKTIALRAFQSCITQKKLPSFKDIEKVVDNNPGVFNRNVATIKTWVSNQIKKK